MLNMAKPMPDKEAVFMQKLDFCHILQMREEMMSKYIFFFKTMAVDTFFTYLCIYLPSLYC